MQWPTCTCSYDDTRIRTEGPGDLLTPCCSHSTRRYQHRRSSTYDVQQNTYDETVYGEKSLSTHVHRRKNYPNFLLVSIATCGVYTSYDVHKAFSRLPCHNVVCLVWTAILMCSQQGEKPQLKRSVYCLCMNGKPTYSCRNAAESYMSALCSGCRWYMSALRVWSYI